ncbi:MAG: hypothetical protein N2746_07945 [Deltaproteobacteria bacterium]|nr:hypothetical protein [Deltaproteobacteria bacterium]
MIYLLNLMGQIIAYKSGRTRGIRIIGELERENISIKEVLSLIKFKRPVVFLNNARIGEEEFDCILKHKDILFVFEDK